MQKVFHWYFTNYYSQHNSCTRCHYVVAAFSACQTICM